MTNILPQLWADGLDAYESTTTDLVITRADDDWIELTLNFDTVSNYKDGSQTASVSNYRYWVIKRDGDKFLIESF